MRLLELRISFSSRFSVLRDQAWSVRGAYLHRRLAATPAAPVGYGDLCTGVGSLSEYDVVLE